MVVCNSSPLILLAKVGLFSLLKILYGNITIPQAVYDDVVTRGEERPGAQEVSDAKESGWISVIEVSNRPLIEELWYRVFGHAQRNLGEAETLALGIENEALIYILDDGRARREAENRGLISIGTLGLLQSAKEEGYIQALKPILDELRDVHGFRIHQALYEHVLGVVGELS